MCSQLNRRLSRWIVLETPFLSQRRGTGLGSQPEITAGSLVGEANKNPHNLETELALRMFRGYSTGTEPDGYTSH
jgi:hypothetical protein